MEFITGDDPKMENGLITESFNTWLVIPSLITSFTILVIVSFKRWRKLLWENNLIICLIFSLLALNFLEVLTYGNFLQNYEIMLKMYYGLAAFSAATFLCMSEKLNNPALLPRKAFLYSVFSITFIQVILIFFSNTLIEGAFRYEYTISRVPGHYYWTFQIFVFSCIISATLLIIRSIILANNPLDKKRNTVILISFCPIILSVVIILLLMQIGIQINLSIFIPVSTLIFVIVYLFTENKNNLFRFLVNIPFSSERAPYREINEQVIEYLSKTQTDEKLSLKEMMTEIERTFINNALEIKDGNHSLAAELLSISLSTIYRNKDKNNT